MAMHLVTGGAGFLGYQLALALHERGERVRILDVLEAPDLPAGIEAVRADILDRPRVEEAMQGIEVVHHNAALVPVTKAGPRFWQVNVDGTQVALDAARRAGARLFVNVSTSAVFGLPRSCPITEETPLRPFERYGLSKLEAERRVGRAAAEGLPCAIVRPRTIVGPGRLGIFRILYDWIHEGRKIYVIGSGDHPFQFVHTRDLIDFILLLAERRRTGVYNIGAEKYGTLREDLTALIRHAGTAARVVGTPAPLVIAVLAALDLLHLSPLATWHYRSYHKAFYFDISRAVRDLGWRPRYSNVDTFVESYDWYAAHRGSWGDEERQSTHRKSVRQRLLRLLKHIS